MDQLENNNKDNDELLARWLNAQLSEAELEQLRAREDFAELEAIVNGLRGLTPPDFDEEKSWQQLRKKIAEAPIAEGENKSAATPLPHRSISSSPSAKRRFIFRKYAVAAAVMLVAALLAWLLMNGDQYPVTDHVATGPGEKKEIELPDGSTALLNASSTIGYSPDHWKDRRSVVLKGEALFKAKKGLRFTVHAEQGEVVVVGTQFNVYARKTELEVKCLEGQVQVISPSGTERVLLKQREQVRVLNGRMQKRSGLDAAPTWQKGESSFRNAPLTKVLTDLESQYGLTILTDSLGQRTFSGKFVHNNLEKAVKMVCETLNLHCTLQNDTLRIGNR